MKKLSTTQLLFLHLSLVPPLEFSDDDNDEKHIIQQIRGFHRCLPLHVYFTYAIENESATSDDAVVAQTIWYELEIFEKFKLKQVIGACPLGQWK